MIPITASVQFTQRGSWTGGTLGTSQSVEVAGNLAVVGAGSAFLQILDITDLSNPSALVTDIVTRTAVSVRVKGDLVFIAAGEDGLEIWDIQNPRAPARVAALTTMAFANGVELAGDYAYISSATNILQIAEVKDPFHPVNVSAIHTADWVEAVQVVDTIAFVATGAGLQVFDVSNAASPVHLSDYRVDWAFALQVANGYAYLAGGYSGFHIINVKEPTKPIKVAGYQTNGNAIRVRVKGNYAFLSIENAVIGQEFNHGMLVLDISQPMFPTFAGFRRHDSLTRFGIEVSGNQIFLSDGLEISIAEMTVDFGVRNVGKSVEVNWGRYGHEYRLQIARALSSPGQWQDVMEEPVLINGEYRFMLPPSEAAAFFRLVHR